MTDDDGGMRLDEMLDALADTQRRQLLVELLERDRQGGPVVVDLDADADAERWLAMDHVHLPKLAEYGIIEYDDESDEVRRGPQFGEIRPLLELLYDHEDELPGAWLRGGTPDDDRESETDG